MQDHLLGIELDEETPYEEPEGVDLWRQGVSLQAIQQTPGWDVTIGILRALKDDAVQKLTTLLPGDPAVLQAHAAASGIVQMFNQFEREVFMRLTASDPRHQKQQDVDVLPK